MTNNIIDFTAYKLSKKVHSSRYNPSFQNLLAVYLSASIQYRKTIDNDTFDIIFKQGINYLFINKKCFMVTSYNAMPRLFFIDLGLLPEKKRGALLSILILRYGYKNIIYTQNPYLANLEVCKFETQKSIGGINDKTKLKRALKQLERINKYQGEPIPAPTRLQHLIIMNRERAEYGYSSSSSIASNWREFISNAPDFVSSESTNNILS